jgi:urease accessory protein UreH
MSGRHARGERWLFASLAHELAVSRAGSLEYLKRYQIKPLGEDVSRPWVVGDASYLGTTLVAGPTIDAEGRLRGGRVNSG